ncbi:hypothetical protein [Ponticaulis sp.]|uniref:hypothetical protein n=1 Tax=Ponticaulis sp. TaxID=2020902 RepID=UPI000C385723|nr:hypothetical protein [Ponticaulis sp.]MAF56862.1 hypothetical protein [Ponticaulis sp.]MBN03659.1 hypothetical protein [Ponticaulis sp.]
MLRAILISAALVVTVLPGWTEISDASFNRFNSAVEAGDPQTIEAASRELMADAMRNPDDPNALLATYEAATRLCATDCASAIPGAEFALSFPDTGDYPNIADRQLLLAYARFSATSDPEMTSALEVALISVTEPSLLSVRAATELYINHVAAEHWEDARRTSLLAVEHIRPVKSSAFQAYFNAIEAHALSWVNAEEGSESLENIVRWHAEVRQAFEVTRNAVVEIPEWLYSMYWRSKLWDAVVSVRPDSRGATGRQSRYVSERESARIFAEFPLPAGVTSIEDDSAPFWEGEGIGCDGRWDIPPSDVVPQSAYSARWNLSGVVVKMTLDAEGNIKSKELIAEVPYQALSDVLEPMNDWRWIVDEDVDRSSCTLEDMSIPVMYTFAINVRRN